MIGALVVPALYLYSYEVHPSNDLEQYSRARPIRPYGARLGMRVLRRNLALWRLVSAVALFVFAACLAARFGTWPAIVVLGLPIVRVAAQFPWTQDAVALAFFAALLVWPEAWWIALLGGLFSERVPVFGALATWSLLPLLGLIPFALAFLFSARASAGDGSWLYAPLASGHVVRRRLLNPLQTILPWGVLLLGIAGLGVVGWITLAIAYAQLLVAHDVARLYQWAFVPLLLGLMSLPIPEWGWPLLALTQFVQPWRDSL